MSIEVIEGRFASADKEHRIAYTVWKPEGNPRAVVQIVHGMCEHIGRYDELARFLAGHGMVVCGEDHLGHGRTAKDESELGYFGGKGSHVFLADDVDGLRREMRKTYRNLPYVLFGHSMGSFIVRDYAVRYGENIDGLIICGTAGTNKLLGFAIKLSGALCKLRGRKYRSKFLANLAFKDYNKDFPGDGDDGWITSDPERRGNYAGDPYCGFLFTVGGYNEMFRLLGSVSGEQWAQKVPVALPIFIVAGSMDPVGAKGAGPLEVNGLLADHEQCDLDCRIYEGMRHEIHNEIGREQVMDDLLRWIEHVIDGAVECATIR